MASKRALVEYSDSPSSQEVKSSQETSKKSPELKLNYFNLNLEKDDVNVRKRIRKPENWKANQRKIARQNGHGYINSKGKVVSAKNIKQVNCNCRFKCHLNISKEEREVVFSNYYKLDINSKRNFLLSCSKMAVSKRTDKKEKRKKFSFQYFLIVEGKQIRVCQEMFLGTLAISKNSIYYLHKRKNYGNTPAESKWGKHPKKVIDEEVKQNVRDHINSFPRVESHYCRSSTRKEYLESDLNLSHMYRLYEEQCDEKKIKKCTKSFYEHIFNTEFNIGFHKPKSDVCDKCAQLKSFEEGKLQISDEEVELLKKHKEEKEGAKIERDNDRKQTDPTICVVCFDLENVISLPKSNINLSFYKRKFSVFNMTAQAVSVDINKKKRKVTYCCLWDEATGGRAGNDMASAVTKILHAVSEDFPQVKILQTWSDSCVPQNRNSMMSFAIGHFLASHVNIEKVVMKFSTAGHSGVQEVDAVHSSLERLLKYDIIYSPVTLLPKIENWCQKKGGRYIKMEKNDFLDYSLFSNQLNYKDVPFSKVAQISIGKELSIGFKLSHKDDNFIKVSLERRKTRNEMQNFFEGIIVKPISRILKLAKAKVEDIKSMFPFMYPQDRAFYENIFNNKPEGD